MIDVNKDVWVTTNSNKNIHLNNIIPEDISIEDISHSLSQICRFSGQCNVDYKVAQHCCIMHDIADDEFKFEALLHDAAEFVIGDIPAPVKWIISDINQLEEYVYQKIAKRFNIPPTIADYVKRLDLIMLKVEGIHLFDTIPNWVENIPLEVIDINFDNIWSVETCKQEFMKRYMRYKL